MKFYFKEIISFMTHNTNKFVEYTRYLAYKIIDPQITKQYTNYESLYL